MGPFGWVLVSAGIAAAAVLADRLLLAAEARGWIYYRRRQAQSGSVSGAAFGPAFDLLQPSRQITVEQAEHDRIAPVSDEEGQRHRPDAALDLEVRPPGP